MGQACDLTFSLFFGVSSSRSPCVKSVRFRSSDEWDRLEKVESSVEGNPMVGFNSSFISDWTRYMTLDLTLSIEVKDVTTDDAMRCPFTRMVQFPSSHALMYRALVAPARLFDSRHNCCRTRSCLLKNVSVNSGAQSQTLSLAVQNGHDRCATTSKHEITLPVCLFIKPYVQRFQRPSISRIFWKATTSSLIFTVANTIARAAASYVANRITGPDSTGIHSPPSSSLCFRQTLLSLTVHADPNLHPSPTTSDTKNFGMLSCCNS